MVLLKEYCEKIEQYPCYATEEEADSLTTFMDIIKEVCKKISVLKRIVRWETLTRFVQHIFNWCHFNESKEKKGYYSKRLQSYGTHCYGAAGHFAKMAGVGRSTGYRWMRLLIELGLVEKDRFYGQQNYFVRVDRFESFLREKTEDYSTEYTNQEDIFLVSHGDTFESHGDTFESHGDTALKYIHNKNNKIKSTPIKEKEGVEIKNNFLIKNKECNLESETTKEVEFLFPEENKSNLKLKEPPNPPLTENSNALATVDYDKRDKLVVAQASEKFIGTAIMSKLLYKPSFGSATVIENVPDYLYTITWSDGTSNQYVYDALGGDSYGEKHYWRVDYLSWIWNYENVSNWSEFKYKKVSTQDGYVLLANKHSRWCDRRTKTGYAECLYKRLESFNAWKSKGFPCPQSEEDIDKSEADKVCLVEKENAILEYSDPRSRVVNYWNALKNWLDNSGFNWKGYGGDGYFYDEIKVFSDDDTGPANIPGHPVPEKQLTPNTIHLFETFKTKLMDRYLDDLFMDQWGFLPERV